MTEDFSCNFSKKNQVLVTCMGPVTRPEARIAAPLVLPASYAKHSHIFEGMVVIVLSAFPFKTVIKKQSH